MRLINFVLAVVLACIVAACGDSSNSAQAGASSAGGGGAGAQPPENGALTRVVGLSWAPNHESGVNSAGGGYEIAIGGATIDVPYTSGANAPTAIEVPLKTGTYAVTVRAYAALDPQGGPTRSFSEPSAQLTVNIP